MRKSMAEKNVSMTQTDILQILENLQKTALVINSDYDSVSAASYFAELKNQNIQKLNLHNRSHASLIAFDNKDA